MIEILSVVLFVCWQLCWFLLYTAIPEDALNDESGEEEDKENPDERISSKFGLNCLNILVRAQFDLFFFENLHHDGLD